MHRYVGIRVYLNTYIFTCIPLYCIVLYLSISIALLAACAFQKRSRPQQLTLFRSLHAEALQATVSEGLAQGLNLAARAGFEPTTLQSKGVISTNAPPSVCVYVCSYMPIDSHRLYLPL